jgi:hypothetical protein
LQDLDPELEVMDPDLFTLSYIFIEKDALKCHVKTFKIVGIVKE